MSQLVLMVSDTHMPRRGRSLPQRLTEDLRAADLILHAGDITQQFVLDLLAEFAPVAAVAGNNDPPELVQRLGWQRIVLVGDVRIGLTHGDRKPGRTTPERAWLAFAAEEPRVDAICFGHSHMPSVSKRDGIWMLNPGSPTDRRREPTFSYLRVQVEGRELRPELVRF